MAVAVAVAVASLTEGPTVPVPPMYLHFRLSVLPVAEDA